MDKRGQSLIIKKCFVLFFYIILTIVGFTFYREERFYVFTLAMIISFLPDIIIPFKKDVSFIGGCVFLCFLLYLVLSYLNDDFQSLLIFSLILFDYLLFVILNILSIKLFDKDIDLISLRIMSKNATLLDILYSVLKYVLCISWAYILIGW